MRLDRFELDRDRFELEKREKEVAMEKDKAMMAMMLELVKQKK